MHGEFDIPRTTAGDTLNDPVQDAKDVAKLVAIMIGNMDAVFGERSESTASSWNMPQKPERTRSGGTPSGVRESWTDLSAASVLSSNEGSTNTEDDLDSEEWERGSESPTKTGPTATRTPLNPDEAALEGPS